MVAEHEPAESSPKRYNPNVQHHLNFVQRLASLSNHGGDDQKCPFHARRFVERQKTPKRVVPHRENSEDVEGPSMMTEKMDEPELDMGEATEEEELEKSDDDDSKIRRHIHPCVCDLTKSQRKRIKKHLDHKALMHRKYDTRIREIEEELARLEEERLEREREMEEQQELFGDEYELVGSKKKRKKRSARRASMVSLGVKQVINWRKAPRIEVKMTRGSTLRKEHAAYCGHHPIPESPIKHLTYGDEPTFKVRETRAFSLRHRCNRKRIKYLLDHEDKKRRFDIPYWV